MAYEGQLAEMVKYQGFKEDRGDAYYARPTRAGRFPGVVVIHHLPGWDEWIIEVTRKFAHYGYAAIAPHLYFRDGPGSPDQVTDHRFDGGQGQMPGPLPEDAFHGGRLHDVIQARAGAVGVDVIDF